MGRMRFLVFYVVCGVAATLTHAFLVPGLGHSAGRRQRRDFRRARRYLLLYPRARVRVLFIPFPLILLRTFYIPALIVLGLWFVIQVLSGLGSDIEEAGVAFWAHVGRFVAGGAR